MIEFNVGDHVRIDNPYSNYYKESGIIKAISPENRICVMPTSNRADLIWLGPEHLEKILNDKLIRRVAYLKTEGAVNYLSKYIILGTIGLFLLLFAKEFFSPTPVDDCDISASQRCGMRVYRDNLTGLEYLATSSGNLTPRLRADGSQVKKE